MATKKKAAAPAAAPAEAPKKNQALAIIGLILNIIVLPGLGSLIGGKTRDGVWQLVLFIVGIPLCLVLIGFPMMLAAWIWGIVTGVRMVQEAN